MRMKACGAMALMLVGGGAVSRPGFAQETQGSDAGQPAMEESSPAAGPRGSVAGDAVAADAPMGAAGDDEPGVGAAAAGLDASSTETASVAVAAGQEDQPAAADEKDDEPPRPPWEEKSDIDVRGFVHALYEIEDDEPTHEFELQRARLTVEWSQGRLLEGQLEFEATDADAGRGALELLRDAYIRIRPLRALEFRVGQFKKPFGAIELWGRGSLPLIDRGLANDWLVSELGYGDRDVGAQIEGRLLRHPRLEYQVGVFNGAGANAGEDGDSKDVAGRLELRPLDMLELFASGSLKHFDEVARPDLPSRAVMGEVGAELEIGEATILAQGMYGQNYYSIDEAESWAAVLYAGYMLPLTDVWRLQLEPLAKGEVVKIEDHVRDAHIFEVTAGVNLHVGDLFRLMVQGDILRPMDNTLPLWEERSRLMVQAALNMR